MPDPNFELCLATWGRTRPAANEERKFTDLLKRSNLTSFGS